MTGITEAICWETQAREPADFAVKKRDYFNETHHYGCPSEGCGYPVVPAHWHATGVAWYRSVPFIQSDNHVVTCPHRREVSAEFDAAKRESFHRVDKTERFLIPNVLDDLELKVLRSWPEENPPSRQQWAELARRAPKYRLSGNIEEVADAYLHLKGRQARTKHPLEVNGNESNYEKALPYIWDVKRPYDRAEWDRHVVRSYGIVQPVTDEGGAWFLDIAPPKRTASKIVPKIRFRVSESSVASDPKKSSLPGILAENAGGLVMIFWHGAPPKLQRGREYLGARRQNNASFAIRPLPKMPLRVGHDFLVNELF